MFSNITDPTHIVINLEFEYLRRSSIKTLLFLIKKKKCTIEVFCNMDISRKIFPPMWGEKGGNLQGLLPFLTP